MKWLGIWLVLVVIAALLAGCAQMPAGQPMALQAPDRFNHKPGPILVKDVDIEVIHQACGPRADACAFPQLKPCLILLNKNTRYDRASLLRHEIAHCNGWPGTHPLT